MSETNYTARFRGPHILERGRDSFLTCPVYTSGALVAPSGGTVTIYDNQYTAIVSAASVTIAGSIAGYTVSAATTSGRTLEEGWIVEWSLTLSSVTEVFTNTAHLVRKKLRPTVTLDDLYARHTVLDPSKTATCIHSMSVAELQRKVDAAFEEIEAEIYGMGQFPSKIPDPSSIRRLHIAKSLVLLFEDLSTRLNESYEKTADTHRKEALEAMRTLRWNPEQADDIPTPDMNARRGALPGAVYLSSRGGGR